MIHLVTFDSASQKWLMDPKTKAFRGDSVLFKLEPFFTKITVCTCEKSAN